MEYDPVSEQELLREMRHVRRALKRRRLLWGLLICVIIMVAAGWFVFNRYLVLASVPTTAMEGAVAGNSVVLCLRREAGNGICVRGQRLCFSKSDDVICVSFERLSGIIDNTGFLDEVIDPQW